MGSTPVAKAAAGKDKAPGRRLPPVADYSDAVTDEHLSRIKTLVPDEEHEDGKVVSGPAW